MSTPEAEIVAANHGVRNSGLPALDMLERLFGGDIRLTVHEDNTTAIQVIRQGYSQTMRHLHRTHGIHLRWLQEVCSRPCCRLVHERSALQAADIFTKALSSPPEWDKALRLIGHLEPRRFWDGSSESAATMFRATQQMPAEHKGDVRFSYRD